MTEGALPVALLLLVVRAASPPALEEAWEHGAGRCHLAIDLGSRASPRMAPGAAQGVPILARPWPHGGPLFTQDDGTLDVASRRVTWPQRPTVAMLPGRATPYASQSTSGDDRRYQKVWKLRGRLGASHNLTEPIRPSTKPKGMHWATWERLRLQEQQAHQAVLAMMEATLTRFLRRG